MEELITRIERNTSMIFVETLIRCEMCKYSDEVPEGGMLKCEKLHRRVPREGYCWLSEPKFEDR